MDLSIIILNYNQEKLSQICLENCQKQISGLDYEIILVDNNSEEKNKKYLISLKEKYPQVKFIFNKENLGYAKANNEAIKKAQGEYILILNPDVIILNKAVSKMFEFLKKNEKVGVVGPQLLDPDHSIQYSCYRFPKIYTPIARRTFLSKYNFFKKELQRYLMLDFNHQEIKEVDWLIGACLMFKKEVFNQINGFDKRYFLYFEDVDFCRKLKKHGYQVIYFPESKVIHFHRRLSADSSCFPSLFKKITRIHITSALKYFWKWEIRK